MADLTTLARQGDVRGLREALSAFDVPGIVDELERLDSFTRAVAFRSLPKDLALATFEDLDPPIQRDVLEELREEALADIIDELDPDDRAGLLEELPAGVVARLLSGLSAHERKMTTTLLGYPPRSAGRRMTPEVVHLHPDDTVGAALQHVVAHEADAETIYAIPVLAHGRHVEGVVSLRRLLITDPETPVIDVMSTPITIEASRSQEAAARLVRDHGLVAMPVVDSESRLLGVFTVDDAMRVLEDEESEDIHRSAAMMPLRRPYLTTSVWEIVRSRLPWLLLLIGAATLTVNVLDHFEATLAEVVALALFVPLLIGTAGNTGAQSATTVVRAMAVGDVRFAELPRVVGREALVGLMLGISLSAVGFVPAAFVAGQGIAIVLTLSLITVCTLATTAGALTPMLARRVGLDPAVVSAPFITTFVDATGLVVYFLIAQSVLGL